MFAGVPRRRSCETCGPEAPVVVGDLRQVCEACVAELAPRLLHAYAPLATALLGSRHEGLALVQACVLAALEADGDDEAALSFGPWLEERLVEGAVARLAASAGWRPGDGEADALGSPDAGARYRAAVARLPDEQRLVLVLCDGAGYDRLALARRLDLGEEAVRRRLDEARKAVVAAAANELR